MPDAAAAQRTHGRAGGRDRPQICAAAGAQPWVSLLSRLRGGAPQWAAERATALARAKQRLARARVEGIDWYWPAAERPASVRWRPDESVRLLTPFDPIVWDRRRFEIFWGWAYRFEAYTPAPKRKLGYYALPLLWHERVIGWGNVAAVDGGLRAAFGYIGGRAPRDAAFRAGLEAELRAHARFSRTAGLTWRPRGDGA